jgi:hypothetical protein
LLRLVWRQASSYANLYEMPTDGHRPVQTSNRQRHGRASEELFTERRLVSGPIAFVGVAGTKNKDLYHAVVLAGHEVNAITDIHFDNQVIPSSAIDGSGNVTSGCIRTERWRDNM